MLTNVFLHRRSRAPAMVVFCLVFTSVLIAQNGAGQLSGRVTDASGNAVANVTVTATSVDTGQGRTAATGTDGIYKFDQLPSGNYQVKFEAAGFNTVEIPSTTVSGTASAVLDEKARGRCQQNDTAARELAERSIQQHDRPYAVGSGPYSGANPGKFPRAGPARQANAHAEDPSTDGFDHDHSADCHRRHFSQRRRQEHEHIVALSACGSWRRNGRFVFHYRLLRNLRAQSARNRNSRSNPFSQGHGLDPRSRNDSDAYSGDIGFRPKE